MKNKTKNGPKSNNIGRPSVAVVWPDGEFTISSLMEKTGLTRVTLYSKVDKALAANAIVEWGKITGKGRPSVVYKKLATPTPLLQVVQSVVAPVATTG
jgi:hypothetical protein